MFLYMLCQALILMLFVYPSNRCLGSAQRLRSLYGHGYQLEIVMRLPSEEEVTAKVAYIQSLLDDGEGEWEYDTVDLYTLEKVFTASGHTDWITRLVHDQSGHELLTALPAIPYTYLASWWIFEETYDKIAAWLSATFGTYELKERQLTKIRIELNTSDQHTHSNGNDGEEGKHNIESKIDPSSTGLGALGQRRPLGGLFGAVEGVKEELRIQDYSIAQTSLEQIFNQFAALDSGNI